MITYRIVKVKDPRTPVFFWFEIVATAPGVEPETVAVCDTRDEARDTIKVMRQYTAAKGGAA